MANAIYKTTRDGLCTLVSPRVADGILARGLASAGTTPDTVDARTMSRLLRGTIRRDLERTLPRRGLRRSLKALDADVRTQGGAPAGGRPPAAEGGGRPTSPDPDDTAFAHREVVWQLEPADVASDEARRRVFPIATDPPPVPRPASTPAGPQPAAAPSGTAAHPVATPPVAPASTPPPTRTRTTPPAPILARLAERDDVRQWVWVAPAHPPEGRGRGPDPARVAGALGPITRVLGRHGTLRGLHVQHGTGHVLVAFDGNAALAVAGADTLNLGAIRATFRALEEEP